MRARGSFQPHATAAALWVGAEPAPSGAGRTTHDRLLAALGRRSSWELELGFGKGRYLLARAAGAPATGFLGIEIVAEFFRLAARRAERRRLANVVLLQAEALYALGALLPPRFASAVHVYFPDPWPKARHQKRRLLDADTLDLVLRPLVPGGRLFFASDHPSYAESVREVLAAHPLLSLETLDRGWPEGPRTNYEAKYVAEGRPIWRFVATLAPAVRASDELLHPKGRAAVLVAWRRQGSPQGAAYVDRDRGDAQARGGDAASGSSARATSWRISGDV